MSSIAWFLFIVPLCTARWVGFDIFRVLSLHSRASRVLSNRADLGDVSHWPEVSPLELWVQVLINILADQTCVTCGGPVKSCRFTRKLHSRERNSSLQALQAQNASLWGFELTEVDRRAKPDVFA